MLNGSSNEDQPHGIPALKYFVGGWYARPLSTWSKERVDTPVFTSPFTKTSDCARLRTGHAWGPHCLSRKGLASKKVSNVTGAAAGETPLTGARCDDLYLICQRSPSSSGLNWKMRNWSRCNNSPDSMSRLPLSAQEAPCRWPLFAAVGGDTRELSWGAHTAS